MNGLWFLVAGLKNRVGCGFQEFEYYLQFKMPKGSGSVAGFPPVIMVLGWSNLMIYYLFFNVFPRFLSIIGKPPDLFR